MSESDVALRCDGTIASAAVEGLRDIHLPDPIGWLPLAIGWYAVAGAIVATLMIGWWRLRRKKASPLAEALEALRRIEVEFAAKRNARSAIATLSIVLRRYVIVAYPEARAAGLHGPEWLQFLDDCCTLPAGGAKARRFSEGQGQRLLAAPYQPQTAVTVDDVEALLGHVRAWLLDKNRS